VCRRRRRKVGGFLPEDSDDENTFEESSTGEDSDLTSSDETDTDEVKFCNLAFHITT